MADRIEVLVVIDRDGNPDVSVYLDGAPGRQDQYTLETVDPGRGYDRETWAELASPNPAHSPAFAAAVAQAYDTSADSPFIAD